MTKASDDEFATYGWYREQSLALVTAITTRNALARVRLSPSLRLDEANDLLSPRRKGGGSNGTAQ